MLLRISSDEAKELHDALSDAYSDVLRKLSRGGSLDPEPGLTLCRRKWKLEGLLRQLKHPASPSPALKLVPVTQPEVRDIVAA